MGVEENKAVLRRYYEEVFNKGDLSNWDEMVDKGYVMHLVGADEPSVGLEGAKRVQQQRALAPDGRMTIEDMAAEGDTISIRGKATGTHTGEFPGIQPTGKKFTRDFAAFYRFKDGKIIEGWALHNMLGFYQQLGLTPPGMAPK